MVCLGDPAPEVINLRPVVKGNVVELHLDEAARPDAAKYELKLKNESGEAVVPLELNVFGRFLQP